MISKPYFSKCPLHLLEYAGEGELWLKCLGQRDHYTSQSGPIITPLKERSLLQTQPSNLGYKP